MEMIRALVRVSGRVQGVCFRDATSRAAKSLGLTGWVRNLPDGRVEAVFEGERTEVEQAISFVRQGPRLARVEDVEVHYGEYAAEFDSFSIRF